MVKTFSSFATFCWIILYSFFALSSASNWLFVLKLFWYYFLSCWIYNLIYQLGELGLLKTTSSPSNPSSILSCTQVEPPIVGRDLQTGPVIAVELYHKVCKLPTLPIEKAHKKDPHFEWGSWFSKMPIENWVSSGSYLLSLNSNQVRQHPKKVASTLDLQCLILISPE